MKRQGKVVILLCSGNLEHAKAFDDKDDAESHAYNIAAKYAGKWFRDAYLKDWNDIFEYQQQLQNEKIEVVIMDAELSYDNTSEWWNRSISWIEQFFKKEN